jgi:hypothetical protein
MKKSFVWVVVCMMVTVGLIACGGGGGGSSPNPRTTVPLKTSTLRTLQPGDSWTYGEGSGTIVEGLSTTPSPTVNLTGTIISSITSSVVTSPTPSIACSVQDDHFIFSDGSSTMDVHDFTYFKQDSTGVYKYGDYPNSGTEIHWITTPPYNRLDIGDPVSLGTTTSGSVTYSDGVAETWSYEVAAKEYVSVGNIDYESYKIVSTVTRTYNGAQYESSTTNKTSWLVPGLGFVKQHQTEYDYVSGHALDAVVDFTVTLTSTNVAY